MIKETRAVRIWKCVPGELELALQMGFPIEGVEGFGTHHFPHLDEVAGFAILEKYGKKLFPGMKEEMPIFFYDDKEIEELGGWSEVLRIKCHLLVGIGRGKFDEHKNGKKREEPSSARLVAEYLGVHERPEVKLVLEYIDKEDSGGESKALPGKENHRARQFLLGTQVKKTWQSMRRKKAGEEKIKAQVRVFVDMIKSMLDSEDHSGSVDILKEVKFVDLKDMTPQDWCPRPKIAVYRGEIENVAHQLWQTGDKNILGVICFQSGGTFQVMHVGKRFSDRQMGEIVKALRAEIVMWKNQGLPREERIMPNWQEFMAPGEHPDVPNLYFHNEGRSVFNGSLTRPNAKGLVGENQETHPLTERLVVDLVMTALENRWWPEKRRSECQNGICPAAKVEGYRCPIFHLGLLRCHSNRIKMREGNNS
jgi:hypothetical protein